MGSSPNKQKSGGASRGSAPAPQGAGGPISMPSNAGMGSPNVMFQPGGNVGRPAPPPGAIPGAVGVNYMPPQAGGGGIPERDMLAFYQMMARQNQRPGGSSHGGGYTTSGRGGTSGFGGRSSSAGASTGGIW